MSYSDEFVQSMGTLATSPIIIQMSAFEHHGKINCLSHSVRVSYYMFKIAKFLKLDTDLYVRVGLLHDFFLYNYKEKNRLVNIFMHPKFAYLNASENFEISKKEKNAILSHMFPATTTFPKYLVSIFLMLVDKYVAILEMLYTNNVKGSRRKIC